MAFLLATSDRIILAALEEINVFDKQCTHLFTCSTDTTSTLCAAVNKTGNEIAIGTRNKSVVLYEFNDERTKLIFKRTIPLKKAPTCICYNLANAVIVCDRSGYMSEHVVDTVYDVHDPNPTTGRLLLGHMSMLLHIAFSPDGLLVASCDRDEKIRISRYPQTYCIQAYCLGHTQFVKCCSFIKANGKTLLISGSGDGTVRFWCPKSGKLLKTIDFTESQSDSSYASYEHVTPTIINEIICPPTVDNIALVTCQSPTSLNLIRFKWDDQAEQLSIVSKSILDCSQLKWTNGPHLWSAVANPSGTIYVLVSSTGMKQGKEVGEEEDIEANGGKKEEEGEEGEGEEEEPQDFAILKIHIGIHTVKLDVHELGDALRNSLKTVTNELPLSRKNANVGNLEKYKETKKLRLLKKRKIDEISDET